MWRYLLRRDDDEPAPWTKEGKDRMKKLGLTMQVRFWNITVVPFDLMVSRNFSIIRSY